MMHLNAIWFLFFLSCVIAEDDEIITLNHVFDATSDEFNYPLYQSKCTEVAEQHKSYRLMPVKRKHQFFGLVVSTKTHYEHVPVIETKYNEVCEAIELTYNDVLEDHGFLHSVSAGDPSTDQVVIWTRVTPSFQDSYGRENYQKQYNQYTLNALKEKYKSIMIRWAVSETPNIDLVNDYNADNYVDHGLVQTIPEVDYTVKVYAQNLLPNTTYYYRFASGRKQSHIGTTYTLPLYDDETIKNLKFATGSCLMWSHGFYNNARDMAQTCNGSPFSLFLGDIIYEFPNDKFVNGSSIGRTPHPDKLIYHLEDYRGRYRQLNTDKDFQLLRKCTSFISIYDDHEICDNYWKDGAPKNKHNSDILSFEQRKLNAYRAYFEYNPVRTPKNLNFKDKLKSFTGLYRNFTFGKLSELIVIDTRSQRTKPAATVIESESLSYSDHYMLGSVQRNWFTEKLSTSKTQWIIIVNPGGSFGQSPPWKNKLVFEHELYGVDKWEGYPSERQYIIDNIIKHNLTNVIFLSGGPHISAAQYVVSTGKPDVYTSEIVAVEFIIDAMAAPKLGEGKYNDTASLDKYAKYWSWISPYIRFGVDGYSIIHVTKDVFKIEFWINNNTKDPTTNSVLDNAFCVDAFSNQMYECGQSGDSSAIKLKFVLVLNVLLCCELFLDCLL